MAADSRLSDPGDFNDLKGKDRQVSSVGWRAELEVGVAAWRQRSIRSLLNGNLSYSSQQKEQK